MEGKRVIFIDDLIVRGIILKYLIELFKCVGVKEVSFLIVLLSVKYLCYFGIDIFYRSEFVVVNYIVEEIRDMIGVDYLGYLSEIGVYKSCEDREGFCMGCFNGVYLVVMLIEEILKDFER